jgi:tRNA A-37 threonylcarbamoyl transferase component Bud32
MLAQGSTRLEERSIQEVLSFCKHIAGSCQIKAMCICSDYTLGLPVTKATHQVLVVIERFPPRLMNYAKTVDGNNVAILAVDEWVFGRDVDRGFLGEALAGGLIFPYTPVLNREYLRLQEVELKKRLIIEILQSLVLDFPELSYEFCIEPEYFMYETLVTRVRLFPPMIYTLASFIREGKTGENTKRVLDGFLEALKQLENEGVIDSSKGYVIISKAFVDRAKNRKTRFTNLLRTGQRALFASLLGVFPQILTVLSQNRENLPSLQRIVNATAKLGQLIEDPENHIYVPTATGFAPLANRMDIRAFSRKVLSSDRGAGVKIESIGGILNDVFLVKTFSKGVERKVVVKRFRDWSNFKWFPLTLWSVGTRTFAVLGTSRLERECAINRLLDSKGFAVPKLLHVSPNQRLIFMEYVQGKDLSRLIEKIVNSRLGGKSEKDFELFEKVGELLARVHASGVALGDTKPENFRVSGDGIIFMMDFEQASRNGDKVWDIAEFLYYSGHQIPPFGEAVLTEQMAKSFIRGYLKAGGNINTVKSAGNAKYTKVFSVFTFPHTMFALSNICRKAEKLKG